LRDWRKKLVPAQSSRLARRLTRSHDRPNNAKGAAMAPTSFDRAAEDMGNIVNLGHINFRVADPRLSFAFYVSGLGLTRDPYMMSGNDNMWINIGDSQFHLPTGRPTQAGVLTGLVTPDREALLARLARAKSELEGTQFAFEESNDGVDVVCPWGNRFRCHAPDRERFGPVLLNLAYMESIVPQGVAKKIVAFYRNVMRARASLDETGGETIARIGVGEGQELIFREGDPAAAPCTEHHVQIYLADFSAPYRALLERGLISSESNQHQYNFNRIIDIDSGEDVFPLDHETRSMRHPMYGRALVNRNPAQTTRNYSAGRDAFIWRMN
jgi:catechol 2,3-dioxygenase-like lactoylglutathione lyase family enzyme